MKRVNLGRRPAYNANGEQNRDAREEILRVAASLFADEGYEAVTVRKISLASGVGAPTIYHYFGDKENLYRCAVLDEHEQSRNVLSRALEKVESIEDFYGWLALLVDNAVSRQIHEKLQLREILSPDDTLLEKLATSGFQPIYEAVREKLNQFQPGAGDGVLPVFLFAAAFGFVTNLPMRKFLTGYAPAFDQENLEEAERAAFASLLRHCVDETLRNIRHKTTITKSEAMHCASETIAELKATVSELSVKLARLEEQLESGGVP